MNRYQHEFGGASSTHTNSNLAMSGIAIHHDVNHHLTTDYPVDYEQTAEERQRRQRDVAMAKAAAVTRLYGGAAPELPSLPVAHPVQPTPTAVVTRAPATVRPRYGAAAEPDFLALSGSFRKSSSSLLSNEGNLVASDDSQDGDSHEVDASPPRPPPLQTDVTSLLLTPSKPQSKQQQQQSEPSYSPELTAEVTRVVVANPPQQMPTARRVSESSAYDSQTARQQYRERPSFQATDSYTSSKPPQKYAPGLYPSVAAGGTTPSFSSSCHNNNISGGGLLRGLAIEEQANMLQRIQQQQQQSLDEAEKKKPKAVDDSQTLAIQEQEKLWQQLSNSHNSLNTAVTTATASVASLSPTTTPPRTLTPLEEQAKLWEQLAMNNNNTNNNNQNSSQLGSSMPNLESSRIRRDPLEEQAQLLQAYQRNRSADTARSAVEEQERMLRSYQQKRPVCPIEEQAKRLKEIQDAKDKQVMEMACKISQTADRRDEQELSLQYIMDMSRREAEAHSRAQRDLERAVLQEALQRSQRDVAQSLQDHLRQHEQSVDLELRRSIAELACQSSERTLETTGTPPRPSVGVGHR